MAHPNVDLLNRGYDAFEKGDLDTLRQLFTEDIVFHAPGKSRVSGDYRGQDEVFGFFGKLVELSGGTFKIERHAVIADDTHGVVLSTGTAQRDGKTLSVRTVDTFHLSDGKVSEIWTFTDDQYAEDEFFA
jgi:ketosteroid isomerase-like protein